MSEAKQPGNGMSKAERVSLSFCFFSFFSFSGESSACPQQISGTDAIAKLASIPQRPLGENMLKALLRGRIVTGSFRGRPKSCDLSQRWFRNDVMENCTMLLLFFFFPRCIRRAFLVATFFYKSAFEAGFCTSIRATQSDMTQRR